MALAGSRSGEEYVLGQKLEVRVVDIQSPRGRISLGFAKERHRELAPKKEINEAMETVVGIHAVRSALRDSATSPRCLYVLQGRRDARINELIGLSRDRRVRYQVVPEIGSRIKISSSIIRVCC